MIRSFIYAISGIAATVKSERNMRIHPLAKKAKDCAAGAVLVAAIGAAIVGCIILVPKLLAFSWKG